jgi:hypothetical protein
MVTNSSPQATPTGLWTKPCSQNWAFKPPKAFWLFDFGACAAYRLQRTFLARCFLVFFK